jgi:hypothetical protein
MHRAEAKYQTVLNSRDCSESREREGGARPNSARVRRDKLAS